MDRLKEFQTGAARPASKDEEADIESGGSVVLNPMFYHQALLIICVVIREFG